MISYKNTKHKTSTVYGYVILFCLGPAASDIGGRCYQYARGFPGFADLRRSLS